MPTVVITGGTGLIGDALSKLLMEKGYHVIILTRDASSANKKFSKSGSQLSAASWNIKKQTIDKGAIQQADYIVHLAGAGVADKRWTKKRKKQIVESRTKSSALIVKALNEIPNNIKAVISASAIGWYVPTGPDKSGKELKRTETDLPDTSFLGEACRLWEESIEPVTAMHKRLVKIRTGIVLSKAGGAYPSFKRPVRFGIAAILGDGNQTISWIHIDDLCRIYLEAITNENMEGAYNAVAPKPVNNKTFTIELAKKIKGKFFIPIYVPTFLLKIFLGEMSVEVLKSVNVSADKIRETGFQFFYPTIEPALAELTNVRM